MSYIERDKVSLPEVVGHLKDHCVVTDGTLLHGLVPGKDLTTGLRAMVDDKTCLDMARTIEKGCVAEIYVEAAAVQDLSDDERAMNEDADGADMKDEDDAENEDEAQMQEVEEVGLEDADMGAGKALQISVSDPRDKIEKQIQPSAYRQVHSDSDYLPGDSCTSEEDDEAKEILRTFMQFKKKVKSGQAAQLDGVFVEGPNTQTGDCIVIEDEGHATPYANTSDDEDSFEDSDVDGVERVNQYPRFCKKDQVPTFALGMTFSGKKQFKKAIIRYGLAERKVIKFIKDEGDRVRAKCDWPTCPWVCLLSTNSTTTSWEIASFMGEHSCPPRRDNTLVTSRRIAEKHEKMIRANPTWSLASMKATVQEEMFADVSIPKLKRAKSMVMQKLLDATKGQYQRLFNYQLELLRSNPGSTVIVKLSDETSNIFIFFRGCIYV